MGKENTEQMQSGIYLDVKKNEIFRSVDGTGYNHSEPVHSDPERQILYVLSHIWRLYLGL